jgi:hypothetical protein
MHPVRLLVTIAALALLLAVAAVGSAAPIVNQFGPVPIEAGEKIARHEKWSLLAAPRFDVRRAATNEDGLWMQDIVGGLGSHERQCVVLVDALAVTGGCLHRLSIMCMAAGRDSYIVGLGQSTPFTLPITAPLYQPPLLAPVSQLSISSLSPPVASLGAGAPRAWRRAAAVIGENQCL